MKKLFLFIVFLGLYACSFAQSSRFEIQVPEDEHWDPAFDSTNSPNGPVYAIEVNGNDVFVGGTFTMVGSVAANNIARWDGSQWWSLGDGVNNGVGLSAVYSIFINGSDIYVGGDFNFAGAIVTSNIARWDGTQWHNLSTGMNDFVRAIAVDTGGNIYAGGKFTQAGSKADCNYIAMWDGTQWNNVGNGVSGSGENTQINALTFFANEIYVGGNFLIAGTDTAKYIAKWNGTVWAPCGTGTNGVVNALDNKSPYVYVAGEFLHAGGTLVNYIATYYNGSWQAIGLGVDYPPIAMDYGHTDVFVGSGIDMLPANNICKYDCCWDPLGSGVDSTVLAVRTYGSDLWVGGIFKIAGGKQSFNFGHWNPEVIYSGINEIKSDRFSVYPNPGKGEFVICEDIITSGLLKLIILNSTGVEILNKNFNASDLRSGLRFNLSDNPDGIFYFVLSGESYQKSGKLVLQK